MLCARNAGGKDRMTSAPGQRMVSERDRATKQVPEGTSQPRPVGIRFAAEALNASPNRAWHGRHRVRLQQGHSCMAQTSDVVVIGGGIIGLTVAYYLGRENLQVTLVERGAIGREASWAAAGYLSFQGDSNTPGPRLELTRTSRQMYEGWIEELGEFTAADTGFWPCGLLELCLVRHANAMRRIALNAQVRYLMTKSPWPDARSGGRRRVRRAC